MIEKLHGLQATSISLNDRFTFLATSAPIARAPRPRRRSSGMYSLNQNADLLLIDQIAQRLGQQSKRHAVRQRLGLSGLHRSGSESNLSNLQRSRSFGNLNQNSVKNRVFWQHSNGTNLRRASSFSSLSHSPWRGFRRRGGRMGLTRGRFRGRGGRQQMVGRLYNQQRGRGRGRGGARGAQNGRGPWGQRGAPGLGRGGGAVRGQPQPPKAVPTKEELDLQLDQYMASTKTALDRELDDYMKAAMEE